MALVLVAFLLPWFEQGGSIVGTPIMAVPVVLLSAGPAFPGGSGGVEATPTNPVDPVDESSSKINERVPIRPMCIQQ
jgi:hypothetical protein